MDKYRSDESEEEEEEEEEEEVVDASTTSSTSCGYCWEDVVVGGRGTIRMQWCEHVFHLACGARFLRLDASCPQCALPLVMPSDRGLPLDFGNSITRSRRLDAVRERNVSIARADQVRERYQAPPNPISEVLSVITLKAGDVLHQVTAGRFGSSAASAESVTTTTTIAPTDATISAESVETDERGVEIRAMIRQRRSVQNLASSQVQVAAYDLVAHQVTVDMLVAAGYTCDDLHSVLGVQWSDLVHMGLRKEHLQHHRTVFHVDYLVTKMGVDLDTLLHTFPDLNIADVAAWQMDPNQLILLGLDATALMAPPLAMDRFTLGAFAFTPHQWHTQLGMSRRLFESTRCDTNDLRRMRWTVAETEHTFGVQFEEEAAEVRRDDSQTSLPQIVDILPPLQNEGILVEVETTVERADEVANVYEDGVDGEEEEEGDDDEWAMKLIMREQEELAAAEKKEKEEGKKNNKKKSKKKEKRRAVYA